MGCSRAVVSSFVLSCILFGGLVPSLFILWVGATLSLLKRGCVSYFVGTGGERKFVRGARLIFCPRTSRFDGGACRFRGVNVHLTKYVSRIH